MSRQLLTEETTKRYRPLSVSLAESSKPGYSGQVVRAFGVLQNYLIENSNKRVYPKPLWDALLAEGSPFMERLKNREVCGVLEHPSDGVTRIKELSHVITEVRFATPEEIATSNGMIIEGDIVGTYETLPFGDGEFLRGLHEANVGFGISSRGEGSVVTRDGKKIVEDFNLETWDVVYNPSVRHARPKKVTESDLTNVKVISESAQKFLKEGDAQPGYDLPVETDEDLEDAVAMIGGSRAEDGTLNVGDLTVSYSPSTQSYTIRSAADVGGEVITLNSPKEVWDHLASQPSLVESMNPALMFARARQRRREKGKTTHRTKAPVTENTNTTTMKQNEMRKLSAEVVRLSRTPLKGMTTRDKATLIAEASDLRLKIGSLLTEDASIKFEADRSIRLLEEFEEQIDADDAPPPPPPPPADGDGDEDSPEMSDVPLPPEAADAVCHASKLLRGMDDEEAATVADQLDALVSCGGDEGVDGDDAADFVDAIPVAESKIKAITFVKRARVLEAIHRATLVSSGALLEASRKRRREAIKESAQRKEPQLLNGHTITEWEEAAKDLAERYNSDMISTNLRLLEASEPELFKAHGAALKESKTFKAFNDKLAGIRKTLAEGTKPEAGKKGLTEDTQKPGAPAPTRSKSFAESIALVTRSRSTR